VRTGSKKPAQPVLHFLVAAIFAPSSFSRIRRFLFPRKGQVTMAEPYFEAWALMGNDGNLSGYDEMGIGTVYGYDYGHLERIMDTGELWEAIEKCSIIPPDGTGMIEFTVTDLAIHYSYSDAYSTMDVTVKEYTPADISSVPSDFVIPF